VLAVPVQEAPRLLAGIAPGLGSARLVTDVGSTKRAIVAAAATLGVGDRFVGGHPLAGSTGTGWGASREGLFAGATVYLTPAAATADAAMALAAALWEGVGARCEVLDAAAHDRRVAWTSHLPQALSSALAIALSREGVARATLGPGGRDVTRLADSPPELWGAIAAANADELAPALAAVERELRALRRALARGGGAARGWFERARPGEGGTPGAARSPHPDQRGRG
jgi:prephenate dehydrogenase